MNKTDNLNPRQVHDYGRLLAAETALAAGAPATALMILDGTVTVRSVRSGSWITDIEGKDFEGTAAVVFADLSGDRPVFYAVPSGWLHDDVIRRHAEAFPAGTDRPRNPASRNHRVDREHIEQWGADWRGVITADAGRDGR